MFQLKLISVHGLTACLPYRYGFRDSDSWSDQYPDAPAWDSLKPSGFGVEDVVRDFGRYFWILEYPSQVSRSLRFCIHADITVH